MENYSFIKEAGEYSRMVNFMYDNPEAAKTTNLRHIDPTKMSRSEYRSKIAAEMRNRNKISPDDRKRERKKLGEFLSANKQQQEEIINYHKSKK